MYDAKKEAIQVMKGRYEGNYIPNGIYESGEKYDSTRFDRRIDACQG